MMSCEVCYGPCEGRYCEGCAPIAPKGVALQQDVRLRGHRDRVYDVAWAPRHAGARLASVGQTGGFVWGVDSGERVALKGDELMRACWHADGGRVITGSSLGQVCIHAASDGRQIATLDTSQDDEIYGLEMLPGDGRLVVGAGDTAQLWDVDGVSRLARIAFERADVGVVYGGERNPEARAYVFDTALRGRMLCAALSDGTVRLLDATTRRRRATEGCFDGTSTLGFSDHMRRKTR